MIGALLGEFWPLIAGGVTLILGWLGIKAYGASQRSTGRKEAEHEAERQDHLRADDIRRRARDADGVQLDPDAGYRD